jgi:esterase/lipase
MLSPQPEERNDRPSDAGQDNPPRRSLWKRILGLTSPLWYGWRLIFKGDPKFAARYRDWSDHHQISARTDNPDDPWIFWIGGYSASVSPFVSLIKRLSEEQQTNITVTSLGGHTGWFGDFAKSRAWTWYRDAEKRFLAFQREAGRPVVVSGLSTGSLLAILLAWRHPTKVKALVLDATALRMHRTLNVVSLWFVFVTYYLAFLSPLWSWLLCGQFIWMSLLAIPACLLSWGAVTESSLVPPEVKLTETERRRLYWDWLPIVATSTLPPLQLFTWMILPWVECPAFVAHGAKDSVIPFTAGRTAWRRMGSVEKWFRIYHQSSHPVLLGPEQDEFLSMAFHFTREVWSSPDPKRTKLPFDKNWCSKLTLLEPDPTVNPPQDPPQDTNAGAPPATDTGPDETDRPPEGTSP